MLSCHSWAVSHRCSCDCNLLPVVADEAAQMAIFGKDKSVATCVIGMVDGGLFLSVRPSI